MTDFKNYKFFIDKNKKKTIFSSVKSVHGLNFKSTKKIALLNGADLKLSNKVSGLNLELFHNIKNQVEFYFNLEKNKIFNNVNKKKKDQKLFWNEAYFKTSCSRTKDTY